jgi:hypothetical protein
MCVVLLSALIFAGSKVDNNLRKRSNANSIRTTLIVFIY